MNIWIMFGFGVIIGVTLGIYFSSLAGKQKPWSELTKSEKRMRIGLTVAGVILFISGVVVFFLFKR